MPDAAAGAISSPSPRARVNAATRATSERHDAIVVDDDDEDAAAIEGPPGDVAALSKDGRHDNCGCSGDGTTGCYQVNVSLVRGDVCERGLERN